MGVLRERIRLWVRQARRAFHFIVALVFLILAAAGAFVSMGAWQAYRQAPAGGVWRFGVLIAFTLLLVICSLYSLLKARSVR